MLRYVDGQLIQNNDLCSSSRRRTLVRLFFVKTDGTIMQVRDLLSTDIKQIKDTEFAELKSGKGKKHFDLELVSREEDWAKILNKLSQIAFDKVFEMDYEIPDKVTEAWTEDKK